MNLIIRVLKRRRGRRGRTRAVAASEGPGLMLLVLKTEERAKEHWQPLEAGKGEDIDSPLEPSERNALLPTT